MTATLDTPTVITEGQSAAARHWRAQQVGRRPQEQAELVTGPVTTRTGKVLTEADFEELAAEAERGYDLPKDSP